MNPGATAPAKHSVGTIAAYCEGRDNNFNLLRVIAASLVIFSHAFGLTGRGDSEPLKAVFDISFGSFAVNVFFVTSGFLIAKSWDRSRSWSKFLWARFMRIYPALWICTLICALGIGVAFTTLAWRDFLSQPDTWKFIVKNSTLLKGTYTYLPGTFVGQGDGAVNTSLWTLPYELKMYLALLLLGSTGWLYTRWVVPIILLLSFSVHAWSHAAGTSDTSVAEYARFTFFFFAGSCLYLLRHRIPLRAHFAGALVVLLAACILLPGMQYRTLALSLATPYLVMFCALVPSGLIRTYNRVGDYSYGIYIFGAAAQQMVLAIAGGAMSVVENFAWSLAIAGSAAFLSWHLLESRALRTPLPGFPWRGPKPARPETPG